MDAAALRDRAARLPDRLWGIEDGFESNRYSCFHHTRHIIFRFIPGNFDPRRFFCGCGSRDCAGARVRGAHGRRANAAAERVLSCAGVDPGFARGAGRGGLAAVPGGAAGAG